MRKTLFILLFILLGIDQRAVAENAEGLFLVTGETRCPVCGMFVGKYPLWVTQVRLSNGATAAFDGVKDMAAFFFAPEEYGGARGAVVSEIAVKDYYSQNWTDGFKGFYVVGSDVLGPMGLELIPFASRAGAVSFQKDHGGSAILTFSEITAELVNSLRKGHKMKHHGMTGKQ